MNRECYCEHPIKIVNPACVEFVLRHFNDVGFLTFDNSYSAFTPKLFGDYKCQHLKKYILGLLRKIAKHHKDDFYSFMFCPSTSECIDFQILVPCGHCLVCNHKKRVALSAKCSMETQSHDFLPLFITLTYSDNNLPPFGLRYHDVQLFLKRLRIQLERKYGFDKSLRYVCAGEYGSKTNRPHYHLILWDFPCDKVGDLFTIDEFIRSLWKLGITQTKRCFNSNAGYYLGKYLSKSVNQKTDSSKVPPFHVCSINLGVKFVESVCRDILSSNSSFTDYKYFDKFDGKLKRLPLVSFFIKKMFPSRNFDIPTEYRNALFDSRNQLEKFPFMSIVDADLFSLLKPLSDVISPKQFRTNIFHEDWLEDALYIIAKSTRLYYNDDVYISHDMIVSQYYMSLFATRTMDISLDVQKIKKQLSIDLEKEVF